MGVLRPLWEWVHLLPLELLQGERLRKRQFTITCLQTQGWIIKLDQSQTFPEAVLSNWHHENQLASLGRQVILGNIQVKNKLKHVFKYQLVYVHMHGD